MSETPRDLPTAEHLDSLADQIEEHLRELDHSGPTLALTVAAEMMRSERKLAALREAINAVAADVDDPPDYHLGAEFMRERILALIEEKE